MTISTQPTLLTIKGLKQEFFNGWKPFEIIWLSLFLIAQIWAYYVTPDSILGMISGISGILCVVFVGKGKISNYLFGLIFAYSYFYMAWDNKFYGEMSTALFVYIPAQFIGYFMWKQNMVNETQGELVKSKMLTLKGWGILTISVVVATIAFYLFLRTTDGHSIGLDGLTTVLVIAAQLLMIYRYSEQWILWILINVLSIMLWADTPSMYVMYSAYLLNSLYGYINWRQLAKNGL
ncbi:nicotinamide riboside transporter PnuC [Actinobacillus delphinicola]|uniref:Nicotinamide riboside transporter PnuC n=1 Tax=Actinobacillus delphinicola TaxID=51161 RepID=A0A448TUV1_9PAST|nr:nicotinamide mononucleotide transporter [Actinobacillus delphinicola]